MIVIKLKYPLLKVLFMVKGISTKNLVLIIVPIVVVIGGALGYYAYHTMVVSSRVGVYWPNNLEFPEFAPTHTLYVVNLENTNWYSDYRPLTLITLQGLVNRYKPRLYIIYQPIDEEWLNLAVKYLHIKVHYITMDEAIKMFKSYAKGYIVYDPNVPATVNLANTLSGIYDCVVVNPSDVNWVKSLGITHECMSLVGMFKSNLEVYEWEYEHLWNLTNHRILVVANPQIDYLYPLHPMQFAFRDEVTALKLPTIYLDAQNTTQEAVLIEFLKSMPMMADVTGWWEEEEQPYVTLASEYGKVVTVLTHHYGPLAFPNPTVWGGLYPPTPAKFSLPPLRLVNLAHGGIYVTFYVTDGDNLQADYGELTLWNSPCRPNVPIAFTISPYLVNVAPFMAWYYNMTMSYNNTFISGPSGAGYVYPIDMNTTVLLSYLNLTLRYLNMSNLWFTEVLGYSDKIAPYYSKVLRYHLLAIKRDYDEDPYLFQFYGQSFYYLPNVAFPIVYGALHYSHDTADMFKLDLLAINSSYSGKPIFVLVISQPWDFNNLCTLEGIINSLSNTNFAFVNFFEFITLVNVPFGYCVAKQTLNYAGYHGLVTITHFSDLQQDLVAVERDYMSGNYYQAVYDLVHFWQRLYIDIGKKNLIITSSIYGPCLTTWTQYAR